MSVNKMLRMSKFRLVFHLTIILQVIWFQKYFINILIKFFIFLQLILLSNRSDSPSSKMPHKFVNNGIEIKVRRYHMLIQMLSFLIRANCHERVHKIGFLLFSLYNRNNFTMIQWLSSTFFVFFFALIMCEHY